MLILFDCFNRLFIISSLILDVELLISGEIFKFVRVLLLNVLKMLNMVVLFFIFFKFIEFDSVMLDYVFVNI